MYIARDIIILPIYRSSFDTILTFTYWIGHCCKSLKKVLNLAKMRTQDPKNAKNIFEKYSFPFNFFSCMNVMTI